MFREDRWLFVSLISVAGYLGAFLLISALTIVVAVSFYREPITLGAFFLTAPMAFPLVMWVAFRWWQVSRSIRRYNARGAKDPS
jgi:hypothetical protein